MKMNNRSIIFFAGILSLFGPCLANAQTVDSNDGIVKLSNNRQQLLLNTSNGLMEIRDSLGRPVVKNGYFQLGGIESKDKLGTISYKIGNVSSKTEGAGKQLIVRYAVERYSDIIWQCTMYENADFLLFQMGVDNDTDKPYCLTAFYPFISRNVFPGISNSLHYKILEGTGGGARTIVSDEGDLTSFNNILAKFGEPDSLHILVAGGVKYTDFEKYVRVKRSDKNLQVTLFSDDPVGRRVEAGERYLPEDIFYLSLSGKDPFTALEQYGRILADVQNVHLNYYDFPTECLWYASYYNNEPGRGKFNDTPGAVEEMKRAINSGFTRFSRVAIRLVPDAYTPNNQQGWWDDKHWGMYGQAMSTEGNHYAEPYLTTKSWAGAIRDLGGIPITYFQTARRSEDYALAHPDHMLFNDLYKVISQPDRFKFRVSLTSEQDEGYYNHWWTDKMLWSYDFTDKGFRAHMDTVYSNLREAGIAGIMYDYPEVTGYAFEGGFEDPHFTAARAYREIFGLAYKGLGPECYLDERNLLRGSDITLGLVSSQRVWADTDGILPEMVSRCGLRWYKNRIVVNYDMDSKDPSDARKSLGEDGARSLYTMCYVTSGRFLLGRSFSQLSQEELHDMSRTFPYHSAPLSARPLDAFNEGVKYPSIYDFAISSDWHQLIFYNCAADSSGHASSSEISVPFGGSLASGGMGLDKKADYYVYDFWNDCFRGRWKGSDIFSQVLRPGEARVLSVRLAQSHPQYLSTNRHIMQGFVDMKKCTWVPSENKLKGKSLIVEGDPYKIVLAGNGMHPGRYKAKGAKASFRTLDEVAGIYELILSSNKSEEIEWEIKWQ